MKHIGDNLRLLDKAVEDHQTPNLARDNDPHAATSGNNQNAPDVCPFCSGCGFDLGTMLEGRGAKPCRCRRERERERAFARIPPRFGVPRLDDLKPDPALHPRQAEIVNNLRAAPDESYFFYGDFGVGKTHFAYALYTRAVDEGRKVVASKLDELLIEYRRFELKLQDDPENHWRPAVLSEDLRQRERRYCVFLDEMEKASPTEFAAKRLFHLIDAVQEFGHQLVITSNKSPEQLQTLWSRQDEVWGGAIARRLAQVCTLVEMF